MKKKFRNILTLVLIVAMVFCEMVVPANAANKYEKIETKHIYYISSAMNSNLYLDVEGASKKDCGNVLVYNKNKQKNQQWKFVDVGSGWYKIVSVNSNKVLDVLGGKGKDGATVGQYSYNGGDNQKWQLISTNDGFYYIKSKLGNYYLDAAAPNGKIGSGTDVIVYKLNKGYNQKWSLTTTTFEDKCQSFLKDKRFKNGASWSAKTKYLSSYSGSGCCAYAADFVKYVFDSKTPRNDRPFSTLNDIHAGDVIQVKNSDHWFVVLKRNGNSLKVAEGNWGGKVVVSDGTYTIKNGQLYRKGSKFRTFSVGYHFQ